MDKNSMNINIWEKIGRLLTIEWILHFSIMVVIEIFFRPPSPTPISYRILMWILLISWVILIVPLTLSTSYMFIRECKRKKLLEILNMTDREIIEYLKVRNVGYYNFLREMSYDGQIALKVREYSKEMLFGMAAANKNGS